MVTYPGVINDVSISELLDPIPVLLMSFIWNQKQAVVMKINRHESLTKLI